MNAYFEMNDRFNKGNVDENAWMLVKLKGKNSIYFNVDEPRLFL